MVGRPTSRKAEKDGILDPITGKPIADSRINSLVRGSEVEDESGLDGTETPEVVEFGPPRARDGVQHIAHIEDADDVGDVVSALADIWEEETGG